MKKAEWKVIALHFLDCYVTECGNTTLAIKELLNFTTIKDLRKEFLFREDEIEEALKDKSE